MHNAVSGICRFDCAWCSIFVVYSFRLLEEHGDTSRTYEYSHLLLSSYRISRPCGVSCLHTCWYCCCQCCYMPIAPPCSSASNDNAFPCSCGCLCGCLCGRLRGCCGDAASPHGMTQEENVQCVRPPCRGSCCGYFSSLGKHASELSKGARTATRRAHPSARPVVKQGLWKTNQCLRK